MKNAFLLFLAVVFCSAASAQRVYFLYLQSDDQSPFYVRIGDKIHSSATSGFLILPNLTDSTYTFGLGFAKSTAPESRFSVTINQDDKGYIIKNFEDGLALFDFRDLSLVKSASTQNDNTVYQTKTDNFSNVLSKAAGDPKLLRVPIAKKEEPVKEAAKESEIITAKNEEKKTEVKPIENVPVAQPATEPAKQVEEKQTSGKEYIARADSSTSPQTTTDHIVTVSQPAVGTKTEESVAAEATASLYRPSIVTRYSESSTTEGFGLVFFDKSDAGVDTIRILIPASKIKLVTENANQTSPEIKPDVEKLDLPKEESKEISIAPIEPKSVTQVEPVSCKNVASDRDFLKLRKKMAAEESDDEMIEEAKKEFRGKCFSVEQIRYLSSLFLTSAAKYQFFDAAYQHVSDRSNFSLLSSEIKDEYYSKRFKALIGE